MFNEAGRGNAYEQYGTVKQKQSRALAGRERMRYPLTDQESYQGRVIFTARKTETQNLLDKSLDALAGAYVAGQAYFENQEITNPVLRSEANRVKEEQKKSLLGDGEDIKPFKSKLPPRIGSGRKCTLYLPMSMAFVDRVSYNNIDLGVIGAGFEASINAGSSALPSIARGIKTAFTGYGDLINYGLGSPGAQVAAMRIAGKLNSGVAGAISSTTGIALNPNKRAILAGPEIRTFRFTFKMIPDSHEEAEEVKRIVRFFREEMYPETQREAGIAAAFRYPSIFDIQMKYRSKNVASFIKPSYLTDVSVLYNQSSMAFHADGNFQETDITLTFTETVALTAQDIVDGY